MSQDRVTSHLRKIRGDVLTGESFFIDGRPVMAKEDFNVYVEQNRYAQAIQTLHRSISDRDEFVNWLISAGPVVPFEELNENSQTEHYRTFPFCPGYRDVLKSAVIFTTCVTASELMDFTIDDVYVHTLMKSHIKCQTFDVKLSYAQNLKIMLKALRSELRAKEDGWLMDQHEKHSLPEQPTTTTQ